MVGISTRVALKVRKTHLFNKRSIPAYLSFNLKADYSRKLLRTKKISAQNLLGRLKAAIDGPGVPPRGVPSPGQISGYDIRALGKADLQNYRPREKT